MPCRRLIGSEWNEQPDKYQTGTDQKVHQFTLENLHDVGAGAFCSPL